MITRLEDRLSIKGNVITLNTDSDEKITVTLDETAINKLRWLVESSNEMTFAAKTVEWDLFFGPYIKGASTGYIFQAINLYTRDCYNLTIPFTEAVGVNDIKSCLITLIG